MNTGLSHEARASRRDGEEWSDSDLIASPFRIDRDRVSASPFFARLGGVTQVVSAGGSGLLHNRLTHSLKVAQVARIIAERLMSDSQARELAVSLGGLDVDVVEAAALAHDLGHPPFGHLGEYVLDRIARKRFGLVDGFEGNAQTFRILTTTDVRGPSAVGLDLTAAVRASVLKYPWTRLHRAEPDPSAMRVAPRGAAESDDEPEAGASKFSVYCTEITDFQQARAPFASRVEWWQQTVEASVMDTADDIAYAIHDLQDFHRIGVLQHAAVSAEFDQWSHHALHVASMSDAEIEARGAKPGFSLESLRRRLHAKDSWIVNDDAFSYAVARVRAELVDGLLSQPFDGSIEAEQLLAAFSARWTARLVNGIHLVAEPSPRSGHVVLASEQWHEVQILKFVHKHFVLLRPDLALHQRGQASLVSTLVDALDDWLTDRYEVARLPRRLRDLVELAYAEYAELSNSGALTVDKAGLRRFARGRAVIDFVSSLTDKQLVSLLDALSGRSSQPWSESFVL